MIEVLQFIFSSFWTWLGSLLLVGAFGSVIAGVLLAAQGKS